MPSTMYGILVASVTAVLAITVVESLNCTQCTSLTESCFNVTASLCQENDAQSCFSSFINSSLGGTSVLYQNMQCSTQNCTESLVSFAVYVSEGQHFNFASHCCQGENCNATSHDSKRSEMLSSTECRACYGNDSASCNETTQKCRIGEQCIHLIAEFVNGTESKNLTLKGCSNISNSTCHFLSAGNQSVGTATFHMVECTNGSTSQPTTTSSQPTTTSSQPTTTSSQPTTTSSQPTTTSSQPTTTSSQPTTTSNTGIKVPFTSLALGSLLLLGLLL